MIRTLLLGTSILSLTVLPATSETIAAIGKVWTGTERGTIGQGVVIIEDGEITAVGGPRTPIPDGATLIGGDDTWITPGIIAPFSRVGLVEVGAEEATNDINAGDSDYSVSLMAADGFNPANTTIDVTRIEGVTRLIVVPGTGSSLFAGYGFIADTSGTADSVTMRRAFVYAELGESGARDAGGSRPAALAYLRAALGDARAYRSRYLGRNEGDALSRIDAQAFQPVVRGDTKLLISANRATDLRQIIALGEEFDDLDLAIVGADEGWLVADELAEAGIPVIIDPFDNLPSSFESLAATSRNAERLLAAGVTTAFAYLGDNGHQARLVLQSAGNAVANGVDHDDALAAITTTPAGIFGLDGYGMLEPGGPADLVVWDGDPLEITVSPAAIVIDGRLQSLESRQTRLRDRYLSLDSGDKPLSYRKP